MKKAWTFVCALAALSASVFTLSLLAREQIDEKPAREFGSAMAKAHPKQARAMLAAAKKAVEATKASYDVGTTTMGNLHEWSRRLLFAERALANTHKQDLAALLDYWKRTKQTYLKVRALYKTATKGGEAEKFAAASYYLAEAELWLVAAGGTVPQEKVD